MQKRDVLNTPKLRELRKERIKATRQRFLFFIIGVAFLIGGLAFLSHLEKLSIQKIEVSGNKVLSSTEISEKVSNILNPNYLFLFSKKNFLIYPKNRIATELQNDFKRLTDIKIALKEMNTLLISVTERTGAYTWCGEESPSADTKSEDIRCYFTDQNGFIFDDAPFFSGDVYFRIFGGVEKTENPIGQEIAPMVFKSLMDFKKNIEKMSLNPVLVLIKPNGDIEFFLKGTTQGVYPKILVTTKNDFEKTAENLQTAITSEPLGGSISKKYSKLEYIDLRFGNKVYYRFND